MGLRTLARQSSHYLGGQVLMMLLGLVSFPVFTRVFSVADYGTVDLIQRLVLLGTAVGKLGVQNAVIRFYDARARSEDKAALPQLVSTAVLGTGLVGLAVAAIVTLAFYFYSPSATNGTLLAVMAGGLTLLRVVQAIVLNLLRADERTVLYTATMVGIKGLTIGAIIALFYAWQRGVGSYFVGTVVIEGLMMAALIGWFASRQLVTLGSFDWTFFKSMVAFGLPMLAYECLVILMDAGDRVLIRYFLGAEPLGYYTAAFALCLYIQDLVMAPINLALTPLYLRIWSSEGPERTSAFLSQSFRLFGMAVFGILAGVIVCARDATMLAASAKFERSASLVPWIVAGVFLFAANSFFNAGLLIHKRTAEMAKYSLIIVIFKLISNSLLLPWLGLNGAVVSTVLAYALYMAFTARVSLPLLPLKIAPGTFLRAAAAMAVAAFTGSLIHIDSHVWSILARGSVTVAVYAACLGAWDTEARGYLLRGWQKVGRDTGLFGPGGVVERRT